MLLKPFVEELRRHLDGQYVVLQLQCLDRIEPSLETLLAYVVLDHLQAPFPDLLVVLLHGWVSELGLVLVVGDAGGSIL